jgi:2-oxoisovalerate dehydrogenase E1 component alpha subunit
LAFRLRNEKRAAVSIFGDGATSKGDVAEALNIAGVWKLPAVFVVSNNGWAISVPTRKQTAAETLAQKAVAAGIPVEQAIERADRGDGPTLIEALTYRLSDHTTADDASRYRSDAEVSPHWHAEPLIRLRTYMTRQGIWDKAKEEALLSECGSAVENAAEEYLATPPQAPKTIFDHVYALPSVDLAEQRASAFPPQVAPQAAP